MSAPFDIIDHEHADDDELNSADLFGNISIDGASSMDTEDEEQITKKLQDFLNNEIELPADICVECKSKLQIRGDKAECDNCGAHIDIIVEGQSFTKQEPGCAGSVSYMGFDQPSYAQSKQVKDLMKSVYNSSTHKISKWVAQQAIEMFSDISRRFIHRGKVQKGIKVCLVNYILNKEGCTKNMHQLAELFGIEPKFLSIGDKHLRKYHDQGIINLDNLNEDITPGYIRTMLSSFEIDKKHAQFCIDLVNRADEIKLHIQSRPKPSCQACVMVAILTICIRSPNITTEKLIKFCKISQTTFNNYFRRVCYQLWRFMDIFEKRGIPFPIVKHK
jgi:hypothetical protein